MMVALANTDLLALLPVQWTAFSPLQGCLEQITLEETLVAPDISFIRRSELPLTLAAEYFCDLLRREI
ncbi:hypothetical protein ACFO0J_06520 [Castellaniella hirudinis]|uniref:LysR family transcriptional regulator n=2 Tax=Castellaniella TaxID=359336 RepID=A0ABV8RWB1_9BURK